MAFIGNNVQTQGFTPAIDYFSGNGTTVTFTLSRPVVAVAQMIVAIDNVIQNPSSAFTVSGNSITFTSAPLSGTNNIWVEYTSLITTYNGISQSPSVIGDITASGGFSATGNFGGSFIDGTIVDYVTGNGRITTGPADGFTVYNGGTSSRNALFGSDASGIFTTGSGRNISPASVPAGSIIQTVSQYITTTSNTTSTTPIDTGLTATITPKFANSKILVLISMSTYAYSATPAVNTSMTIQLVRNATAIMTDRYSPYFYSNVGAYATQVICQNGFSLVDSPATTSALTYKLQYNATDAGTQAGFNATGSSFGAGGRSTITLMEIAV